jgi:hypothetical protein
MTLGLEKTDIRTFLGGWLGGWRVVDWWRLEELKLWLALQLRARQIAVNSVHYVLPARPKGSAHTSLRPKELYPGASHQHEWKL